MNFNQLLKSERLLQIEKCLREGKNLLFEDLFNSVKALIATLSLEATGKNVLILTGGSVEEGRLFTDFKFFNEEIEVLEFPAWEMLPSEKVAPSQDIVGERYLALKEVLDSKKPHIIISGLQSALQKLIPKEHFQKLSLKLALKDKITLEQFKDKLEKMGYQKKSIVTDKGEFAVRGSIVDLYPVSSPDPFRIEFWDDEVESIRTFDPVGQRSIKTVEKLDLLPGQELELLNQQNEFGTIFDYLGKETIVIFDDLLALEDRYATLTEGVSSFTHFLSIDEFLKRAMKLQNIYFSKERIEELSDVKVKRGKERGNYYSEEREPQLINFDVFNRSLKALKVVSPFLTVEETLFPSSEVEVDKETLLEGVEKLPKEDFELYFYSDNDTEKMKFEQKILDRGLTVPKKTSFNLGYLSSGFSIKDLPLLIFPETELSRRYKLRRQKQRSTYHTAFAEANELTPGDLVVHFHHGIGKFLGIEKRPNVDGVLSEFFLVEYAEGGKLFVPIQQSYLVSRYVGGHDELPKLHTIGSPRWKKLKETTQNALLGYAKELLEISARRELKGGYSFSKDSADMMAFEEEFPYIETEDQLLSIASIKEDMTSSKPMDRLICGDVGYGKTEVAMRAAFKAVVDGGKQVAVLVPTTVLAMQHFENFTERMRNFPVRIGVLSRFRTPKEVKNTLKEVEEGSLDILIGTHRVISEDVKFKDLGLVIIDEEQRFGVKAKEHLKKFKVGVDCLTLSATPIPRTLYMSLVGAREMSIISSPPQDRIPIKTILAEPTTELLKNAILRELARDGQVYVIHNRVETIMEMASKIQELVPKARIVIGHGQMSSAELDLVFHAFKSGKADILVATSIVENGIDIPNANTILIDRADRFGLSDLYQLRGRVGRWNRRAFSYFLVPRLTSLPELSRKRLEALVESSGYGGGMKLAMRDLEIRGAGDLLGVEQSGHVSSVGFHLYCKMLKRTIEALQGKVPKTLADVKIEIPVDARLQESYINEVTLRMEFYQRFGEAVSLDEVAEIFKEMQDRFGAPDEPALWLYYLTKLKVFAGLKGITLIKKEKFSYTIERVFKGKVIKNSILLSQLKKPEDIEMKLMPSIKKELV